MGVPLRVKTSAGLRPWLWKAKSGTDCASVSGGRPECPARLPGREKSVPTTARKRPTSSRKPCPDYLRLNRVENGQNHPTSIHAILTPLSLEDDDAAIPDPGPGEARAGHGRLQEGIAEPGTGRLPTT